jgi:hypothetical protein
MSVKRIAKSHRQIARVNGFSAESADRQITLVVFEHRKTKGSINKYLFYFSNFKTNRPKTILNFVLFIFFTRMGQGVPDGDAEFDQFS